MKIASTITISEDELNEAVATWLASKNEALPPETVLRVEIAEAVAPVIATPENVVDPGSPYSLHCLATCFGYQDPYDNGKGAWGADTNNTTTAGVSIPIPIVQATFGSTNAKDIRGYTVSIMCLDTNKWATGVDIVDLGPGADVNGQHGLLVGKDGVIHGIDFTYAMCGLLGVKYDPNKGSANVIWWIVDPSGKPIKMMGLDAPRKIV